MFDLFVYLCGYDHTVIFADLLNGLPHDVIGLEFTHFATLILVGEVIQFLLKLRMGFFLDAILLFSIYFQTF